MCISSFAPFSRQRVEQFSTYKSCSSDCDATLAKRLPPLSTIRYCFLTLSLALCGEYFLQDKQQCLWAVCSILFRYRILQRRSARTMERKVVVVCGVVGFLGLISAAAAFAAEAKRIKGSEVQFPSLSECIYPRSPALGLGLTAAVALMIAQIIINIATGCICCRRGPHQSNSNWTLALVCFVVSWFTFVIAFLLLLTGAALNDQHGEENIYFGNYNCYVVKPGVFAGAGVLSLASVILGIIYYLALNCAKNRNDSFSQGGIALGQPQFPQAPPQTAQNPVFVDEVTYMRQHFT